MKARTHTESAPRQLARSVASRMAVMVIAIAMAWSARAATTTATLNLGPTGNGTFIAGSTVNTFIPTGSLPAGSILRSVEINATLESTNNDNWGAELLVLIDPTPGSPGQDGLLEIGASYQNFGSAQRAPWVNGYEGPISTVSDIKRAGVDFLANVDLANATVFVGNGYGSAPAGGTWSGMVSFTYDVPGPADIFTFGPGAVIEGTNISWVVPPGSNVASLAPIFTIPPGATCDHVSGVAYDFSLPVLYSVTSADLLVTKIYTVTVSVGAGLVVKTFNDTSGASFLNPIANLLAVDPPSGTSTQFDNINYTSFAGSLPGLTANSTFSVLWDGWFDVMRDGPGAYTFGTSSDDGSVVYLDLNGDGDFEDAGELIVNNNGDHGQTTVTGTVMLDMELVRIVIGFYEEHGEQAITARFKKGSDIAWNALNPINGATGHFFPTQPRALTRPYAVTAKAGDGQVVLTWAAFPGATGYNVKRSTTSGGPYLDVFPEAGTTYTDTAVSNGTTYYYVVSAITGAGESNNSVEASATPAPVDINLSTLVAVLPYVWADGIATATITVTLREGGGSLVAGKVVTLAHTSGPGTPAITTINAITDTDGTATFRVSSDVPGLGEFTATDATDGLELTQKAAVTFVARPPALASYVAHSNVLQTWDFTGSQNPGWTRNRNTFLTNEGMKLGEPIPGNPDHGAWVGMIRIAAPVGFTYANSGVEMTYYSPHGPPPTDGFEFLALWHDNPRNGFAVIADGGSPYLRGNAITRQQEGNDISWPIPIANGVGLDGLHTMTLLRLGDGSVKTYVDGNLVNTRSSTGPATQVEWISIGWNVNGNMYMPLGSVISEVRAFTINPPLPPYGAWAASKGLVDGHQAPYADPDLDGLANLLEFILGGEPNPANAGSDSAASLPVAVENSGDLIVLFHRSKISKDATSLFFQWSTDANFLSATEVAVGAGDSVTDGVAVDVTEDSPDADTDLIIITVPAEKAANGRLFGRLRATIP